MRLSIAGALIAGLYATTSIALAAPYHQAGSSALLTIQMSPATRGYDLGPGDRRLPSPAGWMDAGFDDSGWEHASPVTPFVLNCARQYVSGWGSRPTYWGSDEYGYYLFRRTFTLPYGYYTGSTLDVATLTGAGDSSDPFASYKVYVNGTQIDNWQPRGIRQESVGANLQPGINVLAIYAPPTNDVAAPSVHCDALSYTLTAHIKAIAPPAPQPAAFTTTLPSSNAILTGPVLPFAWNKYRGATYYDLQMWLTKAFSKHAIGSHTVTILTRRLQGTSYRLDVHALPRGIYQWRMAAANARGALISDWTPTRNVTID